MQGYKYPELFISDCVHLFHFIYISFLNNEVYLVLKNSKISSGTCVKLVCLSKHIEMYPKEVSLISDRNFRMLLL